MSRPPSARQKILPIFAAFSILPLLLLFVSFNGAGRVPAVSLLPAMLCYAIAALAFIASVALSVGLSGDIPAARLQSRLVLCLAAGEIGALIGFIGFGTSGDWKGFLPFVIGNVTINVLFILPRVFAAFGP